MYWIFASSYLLRFCIPENETISLLRIGLRNCFYMLWIINSTHKILTSFFVFLLFSNVTVSSLMALMTAVGKKYARNTVKMNGKAIVLLPSFSQQIGGIFLHCIHNLINFFLNYEGIFLQYLTDTFK